MSSRVRVVAAAALLVLALPLAAAADAEQPEEVVTIAEVRFVDAAPSGPSVNDRLDEIRRRIQAALVYPPLARLHGVEGEALVHFEVDHDGNARAVEVAASSGVPSLDRAAVRAVSEAVPLPWVYGRLAVPVRFALADAR